MAYVTGQRLVQALKSAGWDQVRLAEEMGVGKSSITRIVTGENKRFEIPFIEKIAALLGVNPGWLLGWENDPKPTPSVAVKHQTIPILGTIAAGAPLFASQNIEGYMPVHSVTDVDFALRVKGDSMANAGIPDGSLVLVRRQDSVENGEVAVVLVDNEEATVKRFYLHSNGIVELRPNNPKYASLVFTPEEAHTVQVIGKVMLVVAEVH